MYTISQRFSFVQFVRRQINAVMLLQLPYLRIAQVVDSKRSFVYREVRPKTVPLQNGGRGHENIIVRHNVFNAPQLVFGVLTQENDFLPERHVWIERRVSTDIYMEACAKRRMSLAAW